MGSGWKSWSHHLESFTVAIVIWLTLMKYLCDHTYIPRVVGKSCYILVNDFSPNMIYHRIFNMSNTTGSTSVTGTKYPSRTPYFTAGGLIVRKGIIRPAISVSTLAWFMRYIYYWNLQFINNVIIIKTNVLLPHVTFSDFDYPVEDLWLTSCKRV